MRGFARAFLAAATVALAVSGAAAQSADLRAAERAFFSLSTKERYELPLLLIANGNYNGMSTGDFGPRLFRAIREYQASIGATQTGYLSSDQFARLRVAGYTAISGWGFVEVQHPLTNAKLNVPLKAAPQRQYTKRGYAFESYDGTVSVDFSFFSASESSLELLYARLGSAGPGRKIDYKVIRPLFFAIAGSTGGRGFYTRYQMARGGIVGFTTSWDLQRVYRGDRIANMMSNLFVVPLDGSAEPPVNQVALTPPTAPAPAAPAPSPPPVVAIPSPPKVGGGTGTGFFIASKRMLTNAHVVEGCEQVTVAVGQLKGGGRVLARDKVNDLALIETENPGEVVAKLRSGARLGEDVAAFGYPLTSILATSGNFTRGSITATAGLGDDTAHLQMSAPVQSGNSGGPLLDESGNVIGVVDSKLSASETLRLAVRNNEFPQNVNFAIKSSVAQTFLETHGTAFDVGAPGDTFKPADLAAKAQSFSGIIECRP